jgi:hypothetical protein
VKKKNSTRLIHPCGLAQRPFILEFQNSIKRKRSKLKFHKISSNKMTFIHLSPVSWWETEYLETTLLTSYTLYICMSVTKCVRHGMAPSREHLCITPFPPPNLVVFLLSPLSSHLEFSLALAATV